MSYPFYMILNIVSTYSSSMSTGPLEGTYRRATPPRGRTDAPDTKVVAASSYVNFGLWWGFVGGGSRSGLRYAV